MTDLVERLRKMASIETSALFSQRETLNEAASRISQQDAELERMREALARIAAETTIGEPFKSEDRIMSRDAMIEHARAALRAKAEEPARIKWASEMTDEEIVAELAIINDRIDAGFGDGGGSPGEWYYERSDELAAEQRRREAKAGHP